MDRNSIISALLITYRCLELDYPIEAVVKCCMDLCDYLYVNDGKSKDGTLDLLYTLQNEYGKDRLIILERNWEHNRFFWADQRNFIIDLIPDDHYILLIDADEIFHENDFPKIKYMTDRGCKALSFPVVHFYGRPTHYISGPLWYNQHTRLWRKDTGIRMYHTPNGCADDILWPDGQAAHWFGYDKCQAVLYHYGNCRNPMALGIKARKADALYQNSVAYVDGALPKAQSFDYAFEISGAKPFKGIHSKYIKGWFESHKEQPTTYIVEGTETKKLWCFENKKN